eukprot:2006690-Prymnesium_polylepis.1
MEFLSKHCELRSGRSLLDGHFIAYAHDHHLHHRLNAMCSWFTQVAPFEPDMLNNPQRWLALFFADAESFGRPGLDDDCWSPANARVDDKAEPLQSDLLFDLRREYREWPLVVSMLHAIRAGLRKYLPQRPFEFLAKRMLHDVRVDASHMLHNAPAQWRQRYE